jgi:ribonuclease P protein component
MIGRLVHTADFERVLAAPSRSRSAHFAVHHVDGGPSLPGKPRGPAPEGILSTGPAPIAQDNVDNSAVKQWIGCVVPKRHARRAVTRSLLKRQIRMALRRHAHRLPAGLWLVRLRGPFAPKQFPSAASEALRSAARDELEQLLSRAART